VAHEVSVTVGRALVGCDGCGRVCSHDQRATFDWCEGGGPCSPFLPAVVLCVVGAPALRPAARQDKAAQNSELSSVPLLTEAPEGGNVSYKGDGLLRGAALSARVSRRREVSARYGLEMGLECGGGSSGASRRRAALFRPAWVVPGRRERAVQAERRTLVGGACIHGLVVPLPGRASLFVIG
jgi:hypothetical protein